ncbi:MAG: hypothetical protein PHS97_00330 [Oscillospiraceae bacterium]|nr:hypothetical protein [Oscillospiraceae bacterium]
MEKQKMPFSEFDIQKVLGSSEGKSLIALLNQDGGAVLRKAADALKSGRQEDAKQLLEPLMRTPEAQELVRKINEK